MQTIKSTPSNTILITPFEYDLLAQTMLENGNSICEVHLSIQAIDDMLLMSRKYKNGDSKSSLTNAMSERIDKLIADIKFQTNHSHK